MNDPHIHVDVNLVRDTAARKMLASTFGLIADLPPQVTTGCGERVPRAMTSARPVSVTCLPCREHAARWHTRAADELAELQTMYGPSLVVPPDHVVEAVRKHRDLAKRFAGG